MLIWIIMPIAILIISILAGIFFFYITSPLSKTERKKQIDEVANLFVNFVLFVWAGKILLNFTVFLQDPLAILAYPSNSHAFYMAVLLSGLTILYKNKRKRKGTFRTLFSVIPVFLVGSFVFEFIQISLNNNPYAMGYLSLLVLLVIAFLFLQERMYPEKLAIVILTGWIAGQLVLAVIYPYITIFGYMVAPWFLILFYIVMIILYVLKINVPQ